MNVKSVLLTLYLLAPVCVFAEETTPRQRSNMTITLPTLVRMADVAGIGMFEEIKRSEEKVVVRISDFWIGETIGTNVISAYHYMGNEPTFPTNVPVVFFATLEDNYRFSGQSGRFDYKNIYTNITTTSNFMFPGGDNAWFRTTRDNGLMYAFSTNLWQYQRMNSNVTNYYEMLLEWNKKITHTDSWRVDIDVVLGFMDLCRTEPESFLVYMLNDPQRSEDSEMDAINILRYKYYWDFDTNGVFRPPAVNAQE